MKENIRYYPKSYNMSSNLKAFYSKITNDIKLQEQLYNTKKLSAVAEIAKQLGFNIRSAEVLQSQAGRVLAILDEQSDDVVNLVSGLKPKTGAQWGRGGGYLDRAGYWLRHLSTPEARTNTEMIINKFLVDAEQDTELLNNLLAAKTFNELAELFQAEGFNLQSTDLLAHQAQKILALSEDAADEVANH
jgi:predicted ribosomally synthesized peptide with nif11-like leader